MYYTTTCPACSSCNTSIIKKHLFRYPGDDLEVNLQSISFERLWILFNKLLQNKEDTVFDSICCKDCGLIFINPRMDNNDLRIKYETINQIGGVKFRLQHDKLVNQEKRALSIYYKVHSHVKQLNINNPKILDYGGASGYILQPFTKEYDCNIIDFERWNLPEKIHYVGSGLSQLDPETRFDVILLLHTLEHVSEPKLLIAELSERLSEDGLLYVEVPLGAFQEWKFINDPVTHVNFFSEESISNLFRASGFSILQISSAFQRVTRAKTWCLNIMGTKSDKFKRLSSHKILSTRSQMNRAYYYMPFIFHKRAYEKIIHKIAGQLIFKPLHVLGQRIKHPSL